MQLRLVDLEGATACCDADLLPLTQLTALTRLSLAGLWRITVRTSVLSVHRRAWRACVHACMCVRAPMALATALHAEKQGCPTQHSLPCLMANAPVAAGRLAWRARHLQGASGGSSNSGSGTGRAGRCRQQPPLDVLAAILRSNRGLVALDLGGTSVPLGGSLANALWQLTPAADAHKPTHGLQRLRLAGCSWAREEGRLDALRQVLLRCPALTSLDVSGALAGWLALPLLVVVVAGAQAAVPCRQNWIGP